MTLNPHPPCPPSSPAERLAKWAVVADLHASDLEELDDLITRIQAQASRIRDSFRYPSIHRPDETEALLDLLADLDDDNAERFKQARP